MSLQKLTFAVTLIALIVMTSFPFYVKADQQELLKNGGFEKVTTSIYESENWLNNNGGYRALRGDIWGEGGAPDGLVDISDVVVIANAFGAYPGHPLWNSETNPEGPDLTGDSLVDIEDVVLAAIEFGKYMGQDAYCIDGVYSWYTSGGGDYQMWQWLDSDAVMALAGETVKFSFSFYPESVAQDGSQNNARAEIYYEYPGGSNTVYGVWVGPTELNWWNAYVIANLPSTVYLVAVTIHGTPDFKAWVDLAQLTTSGYNLYYTYPPYDNLDTYPENGHCITWYKYPEFAIAKVCVYADKTTGQVSAYSWDASGIGTEREAYAKFNMNPPPGNSPQVYENDDFRVGAYWIAYGYLGSSGPAASRVSIQLYVYYLKLGVGWQHVKTYEWFFSSLEYPNQEIFYSGSVSKLISPPSGSGYYTVAPRARTYAVNVEGGSAVADFFNSPYCMFVSYIKMSD